MVWVHTLLLFRLVCRLPHEDQIMKYNPPEAWEGHIEVKEPFVSKVTKEVALHALRKIQLKLKYSVAVEIITNIEPYLKTVYTYLAQNSTNEDILELLQEKGDPERRWIRQLDHLEKQINGIHSEKEELEKEKAANITSIESLQKEIEKLKRRNTTQNEIIGEMRTEIEEYKRQLKITTPSQEPGSRSIDLS